MSDKSKSSLISLEKEIIMKTKQGRSQAAFMKLIIEKLGITKKEMEAIRKDSLEYSKARVKKYNAIIKKEKTDFKRILGNSIYYPHISPAPQSIPEIPADVFIPTDGDTVQHGGVLYAEGDGDGYVTQRWGGNADHYARLDAAFTFQFTPPIATDYTFESLVAAIGPYYLFADDDWTNSKEASINITANMTLEQDIPEAFSEPTHVTTKMDPSLTLFSVGDDNIDQLGNAFAQGIVSINHVFLYQQIPVTIIVSITCIVMGKGEGSTASFNFLSPAGGILCMGLNVKTA